MLHINDLTYRIGQRLLFDQATAAIPTGQTVGLVGRNGIGKSTLLRLILGEAAPDGGQISVSPRTRIGTVAQEMPDGEFTPIDFVLAADEERAALLVEAEETEDPHRIAEIHTRLADIGAQSAPARAAGILSGLGFDHDAQQRPLASFSGGWRMRVALAATLFSAPDLLLLDEPSNHLDLETRLWLESYLTSYRGTIVLVSHDRGLLNSVVDAILHVEGGELTLYRGNYDNFERVRAERRNLQAHHFAKQLEQRRHMQTFIDRFKAKASKARQAQSRVKALAKMEELKPVAPDEEMVFDFPTPASLAPPLVTLDHASAGYGPGKVVLHHLDLRIDMDDRIALLGANGNGKTTLLRLLEGEIKPIAGDLRKSGKLRIGYFNQEQAEAFDLEQTAYQHMAGVMRDAPERKVRGHLGRFGFAQSRADVLIRSLSGGEKARLLFATITRDAPHILLLDEPTNHLDIDAREALISALNVYEGAVILVSHDPHLVELCADTLWIVAKGTCRTFDGDMEGYRALLLQERRAEASRESAAAGTGNGSNGKTAAARKDQRRAEAAARAVLAPLRIAVQAAEKRLEQLTRDKAALEKQLADPTTYDGGTSTPKALTLQQRLGVLKRDIESAEQAWLMADQALDRARQPDDVSQDG
jgi:ATP-binding cassette subfamily F protein 3